MKFFGMVAMLALVSTVAMADDHAGHATHPEAAAKGADAAANKMQEAGKEAAAATAGAGKKMEKAGKKAAKKADKAGAELKKDAKEAAESH